MTLGPVGSLIATPWGPWGDLSSASALAVWGAVMRLTAKPVHSSLREADTAHGLIPAQETQTQLGGSAQGYKMNGRGGRERKREGLEREGMMDEWTDRHTGTTSSGQVFKI